MKSPFPVSRLHSLLTLVLLYGLSGQAWAASCTASYTHTSNGGSSNYTLGSGQSLKIASGTYTGTIEFGSGASICVETGATFTPAGLNNVAGTLINYGTANLQTFAYNSGTVIDNHGTLSFTGGLNTNGATTFRNRTNARMNMANSFQLGNNSTFINDGLLVAQQDFNTQNGTTLLNNHRLEMEGNFNPDGKFDNYGRVYAKAFMNINANSDVSNHCTLVSWGGFNNNSPVMDNQGTILITTATGAPGGPWQNNQAFQNGTNAKIAGGDFINNSTFTGGGFMIFSGDTRNQGAFNGNSAADKITFYDETQTATQIFDVIGVAPTNTVRTAFARPTELDAPSNCSTNYKNFANPVVNDYGDAPATYGDASHTIVAGIHLGVSPPDAESASQYSFNALGDGADEDSAPRSATTPPTAARFPVLKMTDSSYSAPITVTNTSGVAGKLYGWIDFDKNGMFEADEGVSANVASGSNGVAVTLTWNSIPTDIKLGTTFIRLRLTTDTAISTSTPTGFVSNGEVEDYPIAIYQPIPVDSPSLKVISSADPDACTTTVFTDDFNDLTTDIGLGANVLGHTGIRDWLLAGGGTDTYARTVNVMAPQQTSVYLGNGSVRSVSPNFPNGFTFDADGHLTSPLEAIALRDIPDDLDKSHWGPQAVTLSRTFPTVAGKQYRLYFKAIPEQGTYTSGIMRVNAPGGSIHFKAPGSAEGVQSYAIEFTATTDSSTISFVNYGHIFSDWCDTQINGWCTEGGLTNGTAPNELIIDDVMVAAVDACEPPFPVNICGKSIDNPLELDFSGTATLVSGTAKQVGSVYRFSNVSSGVDALVTLNALQANSLPRWLEGDLGGQLQGAQTNKYFDMTVNLVQTGTATAISPVDLVLTSFDVDGSAGEPYSDGIEYFSPAATFTGAGSQLQASDMGDSVRYALPLSARGVDDATAVDPAYAAGAVYTDVSSFRTKGLVVDDDGSSTRSIFIYANGDAFKQFGALTCDSSIAVSTVNGTIFEDVNYGGGVGRAFGTAGTVGISGVRVELYDATGKFLTSTTTTAGGSYSFTTLPTGNYYVRVVNDSVSSSRLGTNGSELAIQTYRSNDGSAVNNEVGGRNPASPDAPANTGAQALNTTNFTLSASSAQAQSVQPVSVGSGNVNGVSFGFNFNTVVNTNDAGQGSLRQVLLNAGILSGDAALEQANGYVKGTENAIFMLPTTDPQHVAGTWTVKLNSALPNITAPLALDGRKQAGFSNQPVIILDGSSAGTSNGITLDTGSNGSIIQALAIKNFNGAGIRLNETANNQIGGALSGHGNIITANGGAGIAVTAATAVNNSILGNSIHGNGGLGIDLNNDGVTANDAGDTDTGANHLLNYPAVTAASFGSNGSKIVTYDFSLDVPANTHGYRLEFFKNATKDASGHGEGQFYLGSKDFTHTGGALKFKGSFNANQTVATSEFISVTVTEKTSPTAFGSTSEFSGAINGNTAIVCTSLLDNPSAALPDMVIDENALTITYLQAKDSNGNPVTYVISGGADAAMFSVGPVTNGTIDCAQIHFIKTLIVKNTLADTRAIVPGFVDPGNFEIPMDKDKDNVYDLEITATDVHGNKYVRTLSLKVMDVNEAPAITSGTAFSIEEDGNTKVADIQAQDPDKGDTLRYDISGGTDKAVFTVNNSTGALSFKATPDYDAPTDGNRDNIYEVTVTVTDSGGLTASKTFTIKVLNRVADDGVKLQMRAFLQGAYDDKAGLMSTDLNLLNLLPTNQPYQAAPFNYAGTETLSTLVKENTDHRAAVDWVLVELRLSPTTIASSRAVIIQRDGNLVDAQTGSSTLHFANVKAGNYYVSVRHRNHLGVMSASPLGLSNTDKLVDFTLSSTAVKGTETRYIDGALALLWVGDINGSNTLTGSGPGNDITSLLSSVITSPENPQAQTNYILRGYFNTDLNMDGKTLFSGPDNDVSILIGNVVLHPLNDNFAANYIVRGGL